MSSTRSRDSGSNENNSKDVSESLSEISAQDDAEDVGDDAEEYDEEEETLDGSEESDGESSSGKYGNQMYDINEILTGENKIGGDRGSFAIKHVLRGFCLAMMMPCILLLATAMILIFCSSENYPVPYNLPSPPTLLGVLSPNDVLASGKRFLEGKVKGPEYLIFRNGLLYTGTSDGQIVEISKQGKIRVVAKLGKEPCGGPENEVNCGRPLGMEFDVDGYLYVCDAYLGIFRVNITTGEFQELLPASTKVGGKNLTFVNDLEISRDGDFYFTDSSVNYQRNNFLMDIISGVPAGRLLKFDPLKGETSLLLNNLSFPNGLLLSKFEDFILFSETTAARITKYHIKGLKAGKKDIFIDNLPCLPDNLHDDPKTNTIWMACSHLRHDAKFFNILDNLKEWTGVRRILMELPMAKVLSYFKPGAMLLEIDWEGRILRALMDEGNEVAGALSHVTRDEEGKFYLGSYMSEFIVTLEPEHAKLK